MPLLFVVLAVVAVGVVSRESAAAQEGELGADCDGDTASTQAQCQYDDGQTFSIAIVVGGVPMGGYVAFQTKLRWDETVIDYQPSASAADEVLWPDCGFPARRDNRPKDPSVLLGCVALPPEPSAHAGVLARLDLVCVGPGSSDITLVPRQGDAQDGSHFIVFDLDDEQKIVDPTLISASVTCKSLSVETPTARASAVPSGTQTPTSTSTPTLTPRPTDTPLSARTGTPTPRPQALGDADCDGLVSSADALVMLQTYAALRPSLPCDNVDVNLDGKQDVIDAALVLQLVAGVVSSLPP